ncbi:hypothetical protein TNCT_30721 [Trichonephila clavata]|uniref:EGF-like domain-containing protein n=1 Tax=Trichonephila clavata TaxID=2740835 RepID=A0A8X6H5J1_TRICU|nr:hypothetical protein TNCT_30721 [Trichonephila clavata]
MKQKKSVNMPTTFLVENNSTPVREIPGFCSEKPCKNGGTCYTVNEKYKCVCKHPYFGDTCEEDPCTGDRCKNGGTCHVSGHIFNCVCRAPFSGVTCEENVCTDNPCLNGGTCYLDGNSFKCKCRRPYFGEKCDKETNMTITDELTEIVKRS